MTGCKSCHALIDWVELDGGARMPINLQPVPNGTVFRVKGVWQVASRTNVPPPGASLYMSHFATCPKAAQHRGRGRR